MEPSKPAPNYSFILQGNQQPKRRFSLMPSFLPKPVAIGLIVVVVTLAFALIYGLFFGSKVGGLSDPAAQATEITRVSQLVLDQKNNDPTANTLAATVNSTLSTDIAQIQAYLEKHGGKLKADKLGANKNDATDALVQSAAQNNSLTTYYKTYLKQALANYQTSLNTAYKSASSGAKTTLSDAYSNATTILKTL